MNKKLPSLFVAIKSSLTCFVLQRVVSVAALAIFIFAAAPAGAETFQVLEDTYSANGSVTKSAGTAATLLVGLKNSAYIKFGVTNAGLSASEITGARLTIYFPAVTAAGTIDLFANTSDFSEILTKTTTAPTHSSTNLGAVDVTTADKQTFVVFDVTAQVQDWVSGAMPDYGFALATTSGAKATIGAKEGPASGYPAVLEVDTAPYTVAGTNVALSGNVTAASFIGNGSGLTSLNASQLSSGTVPLTQLPAGILTNGETGVTLGGKITATLASNVVSSLALTNAFLTNANIIKSTFAGNGGGLTNLDVTQLSGPISIAQLPAGVLTNNDTSVTVNNLTLTGTFTLPANNNNAGIGTANNPALPDNTSGSDNAAFGAAALSVNTNGSENTALGALALQFNTSGSDNTAVGFSALYGNTNGSENIAIGDHAMYINPNGSSNVAIGPRALENSTGNLNIALGYQAGSELASGTESNNIDIGNDGVSGDSGIIRIGTTGVQTNTFIAGVIHGDGSGLINLSVAQMPPQVVTTTEPTVTLSNLSLTGALNLPLTNYSMAIGPLALAANTGAFNTAFGPYALSANTTGQDNTAMGLNALNGNTTGSENTALGVNALSTDTSGTQNTAVGYFVLGNNLSGSDNTAIGNGVLQDSSTCSANTAVGAGTMFLNDGSDNTAIGYGALTFSTGAMNIAVGYFAGTGLNSGTENYNIDIGSEGESGDNGIIRIGTPGTQTNTFIAGVINGDGSGLYNLSVAQMPAQVVTTTESIVTLSNLTLTGTFSLPSSGGNMAIGTAITPALAANTSGIGNMALGPNALAANTTGGDNTAIGQDALAHNTNGSDNTAIGGAALLYNTTGGENVAVGQDALVGNTIGSQNTAVGGYALEAGTEGMDNTVVGNSAMFDNEASFNTAIGYNALGNNSSNYNIAVGYNAGSYFSAGTESNNIDIGNNGQYGESGIIRIGTSGAQTNTFIAGVINGDGSGLYNLSLAQLPAQVVTTTESTVTLSNLTLTGSLSFPLGNFNTTLGFGALQANALGSENTGIGFNALSSDTTGEDNTAIGAGTLSDNEDGYDNTAVGLSALADNTVGEGNTGIGVDALRYNTNGFANTAIGGSALEQNLSGINNVAIGSQALQQNTNGGNNTAVGVLAASGNLSGYNNTALGNLALADSTNGYENTAVGGDAEEDNQSGFENAVVGYNALFSSTTGSYNAVLGYNALYYNANSFGNTAVGCMALQNNMHGTNNIALGYLAGVSFSGTESSNIDIGNSGTAGESGIIRIGTTGVQTATYLAGTVYADNVALTSDRNAKENFTHIDAGDVLAKVAAMPVTEWNYKKDRKDLRHIGPMAQDFQAAFGLNGGDDKHLTTVDESGVALAAIQGLNQKLETDRDALQNDLKQKDAEIEQLKQGVADLKAMVLQLAQGKQK